MIIDAQQTYREGVMKLEGVEPALEECAALLKRARAEGEPLNCQKSQFSSSCHRTPPRVHTTRNSDPN